MSETLLMRPDLFDLFVEETGKNIQGEKSARFVLLLCMQGRLVENYEPCSFNILVNCESGAGKDWVTRNVVKILPEELYEYRTRITSRAFNYWHNSKFDQEWTWDGKICYLEDIENDVLNSDSFKVMASSGSHVTVVVEGYARDIEIKGKPILFLTSATANPKHELLRRFVILSLDESIDQTKAIMNRKAERAKTGIAINTEYDEEFIAAQNLLRRVKVKIPFADWLTELFPSDHLIMRTLFSRFLDWIKASCAFHQYQRKTDKDGYFLAESQDYEIARRAIEAVTTNRYMLPLTKNQLKVIELSEGLEDSFTIDDIAPKVSFISERTLRRELDKLTNFGFFTKGSLVVENSRRPLLTFTRNPLGSLKLPSWEEIMTIRQL